MVYTYEYDLNYLPAMPMVTIQIGKPDADVIVAFSALVDSGVDATMIPIIYLKQVQAVKRQHVFIRTVCSLSPRKDRCRRQSRDR